MTCFQIAHHPKMADLLASNPSFRYKPLGKRDTRKPNEKKAYPEMTSHPLYMEFRKNYGLKLKKRKNAVVIESFESEEDEYDDRGEDV